MNKKKTFDVLTAGLYCWQDSDLHFYDLNVNKILRLSFLSGSLTVDSNPELDKFNSYQLRSRNSYRGDAGA